MEHDPVRLLKDRMIERGHLDEDSYQRMMDQERTHLDEIAERLTRQRDELTLEEASSFVYATGETP